MNAPKSHWTTALETAFASARNIQGIHAWNIRTDRPAWTVFCYIRTEHRDAAHAIWTGSRDHGALLRFAIETYLNDPDHAKEPEEFRRMLNYAREMSGSAS